MQLAVMQPYVFPYLGYFQLIHAVDRFVFYDDVNFIKRGWIHRNNVLVNGQANRFTIPLAKASQHDRIDEVRLHPESYATWRTKFLKTIRQSYQKAPHFEAVYALMTQTLTSEITLIASLAIRSITAVSTYLGLTTHFERASTLSYDRTLKGPQRILALCEHYRADTYVNPTGGQSLYQPDDFVQRNITLRFIRSEPATYPQFDASFVPTLSMIDVLMFNTVDQTRYLLSRYELITP